MYRQLLFCLGLVLLVGLFASGPGAAQDDEGDLPASTTICQLHVAVNERGTVQINFYLVLSKPQKLQPKQFEEALGDVIDAPLEQVQRHKLPQTNQLMISGSAEEVFSQNRGRIEGELYLDTLAKLLRPLGVPHIDLSIREYRTNPTPADYKRLAAVQQHRVSTADPQPVAFVVGMGMNQWIWRGALLVALFVCPVAFLLWQRRAALRAPEAEAAIAWYRFWRWVHWITLGSWLVWVTAVPALDLDAPFNDLWPGGIGRFFTLRWLVSLVPPWLITIMGSALAQEVFAHVSKYPPPPGTIFRRAALGVLTTMLPILLAILGLFSVIGQEFRIGAIWLGAALVVRLVATRLARGKQDLTPHAVTSGELRDRIFELAGAAGVPLKQLYIVPTGKMPEANAFAVLGGDVLITDHLLRNLTRREVDAIAAHELAHLKFRHPTWLLVFFLAAITLPAIAQPMMPYWWQGSWMRHVPIGLVLALGAVFFISRRFEHQTDSYAAWLIGDPEALITALIKVHRLSLLPMQWGKWEEGLLTHPSTNTRLEVIARENGLSHRRLREIVEAPESPGEHYPLPATLEDEGLVFSPAFKSRSVGRITRLLLAGVLLTPALFAAIVWWGGLEGTARWVTLAAGVLATIAVQLTLQNYLPVSGYSYLRRRLADKYRAQGIDPTGGSFIAFAPDPCPRIYEGGYTNWDIGYLFLLGDRLCYVGEQVRFALRREQITDIRLGPGMSRWWMVPQVYVSWEDSGSGTSGTFNIRAGEVRSMRQLQRATPALEQTVRKWWTQPAEPTEVPAPLAELSTPAIGEVTSAPPGALIRPGAMVFQMGFIFLLGAGLSLLLGLPFGVQRGGMGWYIPAVAVLIVLLETLPLWRNRSTEGEVVKVNKAIPAQPESAPVEAAVEEAVKAP